MRSNGRPIATGHVNGSATGGKHDGDGSDQRVDAQKCSRVCLDWHIGIRGRDAAIGPKPDKRYGVCRVSDEYCLTTTSERCARGGRAGGYGHST